MVPGAGMDVQAFVNAWKSVEDALEVSAVVSGKCGTAVKGRSAVPQ